MPADVAETIKRLKNKYPRAKIALEHASPIELLVATILSAQCTDERVNIVTKSLFKKYRSVSDFAGAELRGLEQDIRSTGFYRNKAKNIIGAAKMIVEKYGGRVPDTMEEILKLPGVARKTANIVLGNAYGVVAGIAVDTHVRRISNLLGFTKNEAPEKIEQDLMKIVPRKEWFVFSYLIQSLGKDVCKAINPKHELCALKDICPSAGMLNRRKK
ncbi:MAG: endonuclease III [Endomicrobiales bacterium]|nr:endonuclease III [Endomicrobiales bacterium]